jgi:hypothetical protein
MMSQEGCSSNKTPIAGAILGFMCTSDTMWPELNAVQCITRIRNRRRMREKRKTGRK